MTIEERNEQQLREVATLVASLDGATAEELLNRLAPDQSRRVRAAVEELGEIPATERQTLADDFLQVMRGGATASDECTRERLDTATCEDDDEPCVGVSECHDEALNEESAGHTTVRVAAPLAEDSVGQSDRPTMERSRFSATNSIDQIAKHLRAEHPQTIAAVLSTLAPARAAVLIQTLPPGQQYEVVRRIAEMQPTDDESLHEVEKELQEQLQRDHEHDKDSHGGWQAVRSILKSVDSSSRSEIMSNLTRFDANLAERIDEPAQGMPRLGVATDGAAKVAAAFEQLVEMESTMLTTLFQFVPHRLAATALAGAKPSCMRELLSQLPIELAEILRDELAAIGPLRMSDIHEAQSTIARAARGLIRDTADNNASVRLRLTA